MYEIGEEIVSILEKQHKIKKDQLTYIVPSIKKKKKKKNSRCYLLATLSIPFNLLIFLFNGQYLLCFFVSKKSSYAGKLSWDDILFLIGLNCANSLNG